LRSRRDELDGNEARGELSHYYHGCHRLARSIVLTMKGRQWMLGSRVLGVVNVDSCCADDDMGASVPIAGYVQLTINVYNVLARYVYRTKTYVSPQLPVSWSKLRLHKSVSRLIETPNSSPNSLKAPRPVTSGVNSGVLVSL
jgi:hypothetical protein